MNPITFNKPFVPVLRHLGAPDHVLESPLLLWNAERIELSESEFLATHESGRLLLPFNCFRVFGKIEKGRSESYKMLVFSNGGKTTICIAATEDGPNHKKGDLMGCTFCIAAGKWDCDAVFAMCSGKFVYYDEAEDDEIRNLCEVVEKQCMIDISLLIYDFLNPALYLCKKSPPIPKGHTIAWQKAREHYVLLHKSHTANRKEHVGKALVTDGLEIDRVAHSRRAHFRLLRSPKFRLKQGQRIWVRSAWVGPKEWTDRSGQIYRIIENPAELP